MNPSLPWSDACERNKDPILEILRHVLPASAVVLEIGSGSGQHVVHFARSLPDRTWQPTERVDCLPGLVARLEAEGGSNVLPARELDVAGTWPTGPFDAVYSANTAHIMSWPEVVRMFEGVGSVLRAGGVFCLYGPFNENGTYTAPGNAAFDRQLRQRDPDMGLRDLEDLETLASGRQLGGMTRHAMPANNQLLVFTRLEDESR